MLKPPEGSNDVPGLWDLEIHTPVGVQRAVLELSGHDAAGDLVGVAHTDSGDLACRNMELDGSRLTWSLSLARPLPLNLKFDVKIDASTLSGTSRIGILPGSKVVGTRHPPNHRKEHRS